jgi:hypothetical protein
MTIPLLYAASHYTTGRSILSPKKIVALSKPVGVAGMADDGALAGAYEFCLEAAKKGVKPVLGCRLACGDLELVAHIEAAPGWSALCVALDDLRRGADVSHALAALAAAPLHVSIDAGCKAAVRWAAGADPTIDQAIAVIPPERLAFAIHRSIDGRQGRPIARKAADLGIPLRRKQPTSTSSLS